MIIILKLQLHVTINKMKRSSTTAHINKRTTSKPILEADDIDTERIPSRYSKQYGVDYGVFEQFLDDHDASRNRPSSSSHSYQYHPSSLFQNRRQTIQQLDNRRMNNNMSAISHRKPSVN